MNSVSQAGANNEMPLTNLNAVESIAKNRNKVKKKIKAINYSFIATEYLLFVLFFLYLFQWRVDSRFEILIPSTWDLTSYVLHDYLFLLSIILLVYTVISSNKGYYKFYRTTSVVDDIFNIIRSVFMAFMVGIGVLFLLKTTIIYSRVIILLFFIFMISVTVIFRAIKTTIIRYFLNVDRFNKNVIIVGKGKIGQNIEQYIESNKRLGSKVVGFVDDFKDDDNVLGKIGDLETIIQQKKINEVYITIPSEKPVINQVLGIIRKYDVNIKIIPEMYDFVTTSINFQKTDAYPYIELVKTPLRGINLFVKRVIDILLATIGTIACSPILLITAICIKLDSKGPVLFKQKRIGKNGIHFYMYKFRSMVTDAEELKQKLMKYNEADGPVFKMKNDPRITRVGHFIRKYSIDELPQLINVIKGDMSLIGPRPALPQEVEQYDDYQWRRLDVRPGISGLWQVSGRSNLSFEEWVNLDVYYIENWSVSLDIKILIRTVPVVLFGKGAY